MGRVSFNIQPPFFDHTIPTAANFTTMTISIKAIQNIKLYTFKIKKPDCFEPQVFLGFKPPPPIFNVIHESILLLLTSTWHVWLKCYRIQRIVAVLCDLFRISK